MFLVLLGPPGVGKGTIATMLSKRLNIPAISMGDILRENIRKKTSLGKNISAILASGKLVQDDIIIEVFNKRIEEKDCLRGFISDGFPRTTYQAHALDKLVALDAVLNFRAPDSDIILRISGRWNCPKCDRIYHVKFFPPKNDKLCDADKTPLTQRADQKPEVVKRRLEVYKSETAPLIDFYTKTKRIINTDARPLPDAIFKDLLKKLLI